MTGTDTREHQRFYLCIDLKSFYASVECVDRGLDPLSASLVVADPDRGRTTICLAVTPALKRRGVRSRCRVFEIPERVPYVMAVPRMRRYMEVSADICGIYLRHVCPEDMHVYSIDESFIDATPYLGRTAEADRPEAARRMARALMEEVRAETGICATAGVGTNLFLAKVALDITAKHVSDNLAYLDEESFRRTVWHHRPITDVWQVGPGIARRLAEHGVRDLAGVALTDPALLYEEFGVNAEHLIEHAWGREACTIADIRAYEPQATSLSNGQVLPEAYGFEEAEVALREMVDALALELVGKGLVAGRASLSVGYADDPGLPGATSGAGGPAGARGDRPRAWWPACAGGSCPLGERTSSRRRLWAAVRGLYEGQVSRSRPVRRLAVSLESLEPLRTAGLGIFDAQERERERRLDQVTLAVKGRYGRNALLRGTSFRPGATGRERNVQVGGHRA